MVDIDPPWRLDPLQTITDCQFAQGFLGTDGQGTLIGCNSSDGKVWRTISMTLGDMAYGDGTTQDPDTGEDIATPKQWVGIAGSTIFVSTDGAKTWKANGGFVTADYIAYCKPDPKAKGGGIFVAADGGGVLYKSTDAGKTWTQTLDISNRDDVNDFDFLDGCGQKFFTGTGRGGFGGEDANPFATLWSSNDGSSWTEQSVFMGEDWNLVTADFEGEGLECTVSGVGYDKVTKNYCLLGYILGDAMCALVSVSSSGTFGGGTIIRAPAVVPDVYITSYNVESNIVGGAGHFITPISFRQRSDATESATESNTLCIATSSGGDSFDLKQIGPIHNPGDVGNVRNGPVAFSGKTFVWIVAKEESSSSLAFVQAKVATVSDGALGSFSTVTLPITHNLDHLRTGAVALQDQQQIP